MVPLPQTWDACSSNPGVGLTSLAFFYYPLFCYLVFLVLRFQHARLDNPKAATHVVVVRPPVQDTVHRYYIGDWLDRSGQSWGYYFENVTSYILLVTFRQCN